MTALTQFKAQPATWQPRRLLDAPHRLGFALGAAAMALLALWWLAVQAAVALGGASGLAWALPAALAHGLLFTFGFMPAFMAGFLFTAGPRWLERPAVQARSLLGPLQQWAAGVALLLAGAHTHPWPAALGLAALAAAWLRLMLGFAAMLGASRVADRLHARCILAAGSLGVAALLLACAALLVGDMHWLDVAVRVGLWGFVAPVFAAASHRMIPFFAAAGLARLEAWQPNAMLLPMLGGLALGGLADVGALPPGLAAPPLALASAVLLFVALRRAWLHRTAGPSQRLSSMLQGGFAWLGLALGLQAASLARQAGGEAGFGAAPLHVLTLGWMGSTLLATATRVAAGHGGRPLAVDGAGWALYRLLQLAVLLRLAAGLGLAHAGLVLAAAAWAVVATGWAGRLLGWLGRPRADGRAG
ncbi:NnrS family protein [Pelomonas sp. P7]|uniref:NnrS family protein n=2 Tax=Roseateles TaxID=93681 RepID=A0ABS8XFT6_9BURK|nr:NnrS family protein [Pelomonas sp. P7]MCE4537858.1 NnrS family protein [Pelomonas sp. P7]